MTDADFIGLVLGFPVTYALMMGIMLAVYLVLFRKHINSVFDPIFFIAIFTACAAADVVFLWWLDVIELRYFLQFVATEAAFFVGLSLFKPWNPRSRSPKSVRVVKRMFVVVWHQGEKQLLIVLYILSSIVFVVTQAITYATRGIPILYESRLEYYSGGGGIGGLDRILSITWFISCYLLMHCLASKVRIPRIFHILVALSLVGSAILSGSKSTFSAMLFAAFYFRFMRREAGAHTAFDKRLAKWQKVLFAMAIGASLLVIGIQAATSAPTVLIGSLAVRFAAFGDVYFMAYPKHIVDFVPQSSPFLAAFGNLLAPFRIVSYQSVPEPLGFMLHRIVYGSDNFTGPNARHNVFGLVYFGFVGSIFFSLGIGIFVGFVRNVLVAFVRPGGAMEPVYVFLAISCVSATTDFTLVERDIVSIIFVVPALYAMAALICLAARSDIAGASPRAAIAPPAARGAEGPCPC